MSNLVSGLAIRGKAGKSKWRYDVLERFIQILFVLSRHPEGLSIRKIAKIIHMNPYVCARYIDNLAHWGLVSVEEKGRAKIARITEKGIKAIVAASHLLAYIPIRLEIESEK